MGSTHRITVMLLFLCLTMTASTLHAGPFDKGAVNMSIVLGRGSAFNDTYSIFGVGAGYYLLDGLELGLDYEIWSGGTPKIEQLSPKLNYVFARQSDFSPYIGAFFRRTKIEILEDRDAWGGRGGAYIRSGKNLIMGFGIAHIEYQDCQERIFTSCSDTYPEFILGASF